jgi:hypothetical protein
MGVLDPMDRILTTATARNKKVAEQEASRAALELLDPLSEGQHMLPRFQNPQNPQQVDSPSDAKKAKQKK